MPFSTYWLSASAIFQIVAMLLVLALEFRGTDRRWRVGVVVVAILGTALIGFFEWQQQVAGAKLVASEKQEQSKILGDIGIGMAPIGEISTTSKDSLGEIRALKQINSEQRSLISGLSTQVQSANSKFLTAQEKVVSMSQQIAALQGQIDRDSVQSAAASRDAAEEARLQTAAINRSNAQAACAASYRVTANGSSQQGVDLRPYGGGSCLNGVYYPPR